MWDKDQELSVLRPTSRPQIPVVEGGGTSTTEEDPLPHAAETPEGTHEP